MPSLKFLLKKTYPYFLIKIPRSSANIIGLIILENIIFGFIRYKLNYFYTDLIFFNLNIYFRILLSRGDEVQQGVGKISVVIRRRGKECAYRIGYKGVQSPSRLRVVQYKLRRGYRAEVVAIEPWRPLEGTLVYIIGVQVGAQYQSQASPIILSPLKRSSQN